MSKIEYFPYNHSQIYFRVENLEDIFDHHPSKEKPHTPYFNLTLFSNLVYQQVHFRNITKKDYKWAAEMTLSGNEMLQFANEAKVKYVGDDDDFIEEYK